MWGKTEKRESFKEMSPKNEEPLPTEKAGRGSFLYLRKKQSLLAIFLYQIIRIRITQFFCFIEIAASFIRFLQLYLTKSEQTIGLSIFRIFFQYIIQYLNSLFIPSHTQVPLLALPYKSGLSDSVRSPWQYHPMHVDTGVLSGQLVLDNNRTYHSPVR